MQRRFIEKFPRKSLLIALILHVLFLLSAGIAITYTLDESTPKPPQHYSVPAYLSNGAVQPMATGASVATDTAAPSVKAPVEVKETVTPNATYTLPKVKNFSAEKVWGYKPNMMASSRAVIRQNQINQAMSRNQDADPILLVGDPNTDPNPLVLLMAHALSKYFSYPKHEGSFGIHGRVIVQLTLSPSGEISDPQILQSSNNENFDTAALYAVNKAPRIEGANRYLSKPKNYVVGFLFN